MSHVTSERWWNEIVNIWWIHCLGWFIHVYTILYHYPRLNWAELRFQFIKLISTQPRFKWWIIWYWNHRSRFIGYYTCETIMSKLSKYDILWQLGPCLWSKVGSSGSNSPGTLGVSPNSSCAQATPWTPSTLKFVVSGCGKGLVNCLRASKSPPFDRLSLPL